MKSKLVAVTLFVLTGAAVAFYPHAQGTGKNAVITDPRPVNTLALNRPKIDVVFVLDTTGSMSGLIQSAKEKIWSIASSMASAQPAPEIRMGLVAYRDRGDAYITRVVDLSADLDSVYATLIDFQADGGGDTPESVNQALFEAVHSVSWSQDPNSYKVIFLVGDAAPHMDYQDDVRYPATIAEAKERGIVINTVQCGQDNDTRLQWQQIAQLAGGEHFQVGQSGDAVAIATPFDAEIATLSRSLDETRLYYGTPAEMEVHQAKVAATSKLHAIASDASKARRAAFNASPSGVANLYGKGELLEDVASGRVDAAEVDADLLPASMKAMTGEEREAFLAEQTGKRRLLAKQIGELAAKRDEYLVERVKEAGGAKDSFDDQVYTTVREQAATIGLEYEAAPKY